MFIGKIGEDFSGVLRADFREMLSVQPDWWKKSHQSLDDIKFDTPGYSIEPLLLIGTGA